MTQEYFANGQRITAVPNKSKQYHLRNSMCFIYGGFHKWGIPQYGWFSWDMPFKWRIWGHPYFRKPPYQLIALVGCNRCTNLSQSQTAPVVPPADRERYTIWSLTCQCIPRRPISQCHSAEAGEFWPLKLGYQKDPPNSLYIYILWRLCIYIYTYGIHNGIYQINH